MDKVIFYKHFLILENLRYPKFIIIKKISFILIQNALKNFKI